MILSKRSLRLLSLLHFSVKCFKSRTPVEPWKTKSLLTHPVSQLSLSYSVLEKVHVYAFPQSMDCCWLKAGSGPPTTLKWSRHLQLRASVSVLVQDRSVCAVWMLLNCLIKFLNKVGHSCQLVMPVRGKFQAKTETQPLIFVINCLWWICFLATFLRMRHLSSPLLMSHHW